MNQRKERKMGDGWKTLLYTIAFGALLRADANAAETRISQEKLPEAVRKTANEQSQGAIVRGYSKETEDGRIEYEVEMTVSGHSKDVSIAPNGAVLEVEEEVALDALSPQVLKGLEAKAAGAKIKKVESLTKNGKIVAYEAHLVKLGKHSEIQLGPEGNPLDHEE
jgi:uncharacterized membrane protein YkoI